MNMFNPFDKPIKLVSGPYTANKKVPRKYMMIFFEDGKRTGMTYARWIMTQHLQRRLTRDETVDHIDENPMNDDLTNLQILSLAENARKSSLGRVSSQKGIEKGFTHGTSYGWMKKKCECSVCMDHKRNWYDARNKRRNSASDIKASRCWSKEEKARFYNLVSRGYGATEINLMGVMRRVSRSNVYRARKKLGLAPQDIKP